MKKFLHIVKINKRTLSWLLFIIICAFLMRTAFLSEAPIGLNHDEITFVTNARAIALTGKDLSGTWSPLSLTPITYGFPMSELSFLIVSPILGMFQSSPFIARLSYALFSVLLVVVLFFIARKLFGEKEAIAVGFVAAFNPWGVMFGRTAFDFPLAIFFYMLAFLLIVSLKKWKILLTFIPLFIAFYSYIGTKIIFVPLAIVICYFSWLFNKGKYLKFYLLLCMLCLVLTGNFILSLRSQSTGVRITEISTPFSNVVSDGVNQERRLSITTPLTPIFSNKFVFYSKDFFQKYVGILSPSYQFLSGDKDMHLSLWFHGYFYYLDLIFLSLGFCVLFQKNKKYWFGFLMLILIAPLPAVFHTGDATYVHRGSLIFPLFIILIGLGISFFIQLFKKQFRFFAIILLLISYGVLLLNFINIYLFRFPLYNSEGPDFSSRALIKYVTLSAQNRNVLIYTNEPDALFKDYLFYAKTYSKENTLKVAKRFQTRNFSLNNVYFKFGCPSEHDSSGKDSIIVAVSSGCNSEKILNTHSVSITQLGDGAAVYKIYFDNVCNKYSLNQYPQNINFFDFNVEKLTAKRFCEAFIVSYR